MVLVFAVLAAVSLTMSTFAIISSNREFAVTLEPSLEIRTADACWVPFELYPQLQSYQVLTGQELRNPEELSAIDAVINFLMSTGCSFDRSLDSCGSILMSYRCHL